MESIEEIILPPPTEESLDTRLEQINQLKYFLTTAPKSFHDNDNEQDQEGSLKRYTLPTGEIISCVHWQDDYFISGTDIVRSLVFRFYAFGRPVENMKKFEEGIFSDLRNLKPGNDATLEEPKSNFLNLLYKNNCIRTQKKQKVFRWFAVPHDRLFLDALERDLKREKLGIEVTSRALVHPAISITLDTTQAMFDEFRKNLLSDLDLKACLTNHHHHQQQQQQQQHLSDVLYQSQKKKILTSLPPSPKPLSLITHPTTTTSTSMMNNVSTVFGQFSLFEGSPTYKQRRRRINSNASSSSLPKLDPSSPSSPLSSSSFHSHSFWWPFNGSSSPSSTSSSSSSFNDHHSKNHPHHSKSDSTEDISRLYTCPLSSCGKIFKRLEHLKRHLRTHTMERPYLCGLCGKRFSRSDNLAQHKKTHQKRQRSSNDNNDDTHSSSSSNHKNNKKINKKKSQLQQQKNYYYSTSNNHQDHSPPSLWISTSHHHNMIPPITVTCKENDNSDHEEDMSSFFPSLSASTSSSSISSCQSSPTSTLSVHPSSSSSHPFIIKTEDYPTTTSMDELLLSPHLQHSSSSSTSSISSYQQQHQHQQQQRDWPFQLEWDHPSSCLSSPQSVHFFVDPYQYPSSSSPIMDHHHHHQPSSPITNNVMVDHYPPSSSSSSSSSSSFFDHDKSPLLKPIDSFDYTSPFHHYTNTNTIQPLDSLMNY